jgi:hypothetical protein
MRGKAWPIRAATSQPSERTNSKCGHMTKEPRVHAASGFHEGHPSHDHLLCVN